MNESVPARRASLLLRALARVHERLFHGGAEQQRLLKDICQILCDTLSFDLVWIGRVLPPGKILIGASEERIDGQQVRVTNGTELTGLADAIKAAVVRSAGERRRVVLSSLSMLTAENQHPIFVGAFPSSLRGSPSQLVLAVASISPMVVEDLELQTLQELVGEIGLALESLEAAERSRLAEEALRASEERFRRLAEHSLVGIVLIQNDLYRYVNPAFAEMFGYSSPEQIIDRIGPVELAAPESRDLVAENMRRRLSGQVRAVRYQYHGLRRDGTVIEVEEHGARTVHAQRLAIVATVLDVTAREASRRQLESLSMAGLALSEAQTAEEALSCAAEQALQVLACDVASVLLFEPDGLRVATWAGEGPLDHTVTMALCHSAAELGTKFLQKVIDDQAPIWVPNAGPLGFPFRSYASAPLVVRGEVIGILSVEAREAGQFTERDARHLRILAGHAAATYQHLRLIASLEAERNRLQVVNELSHALATTLDPYEVAERALMHVGSAVGADVGAVWLWDADRRQAVLIGTKGLASEQVRKLEVNLERELRSQTGQETCSPSGSGALELDSQRASDLLRQVVPRLESGLTLPLEVNRVKVGFLLLGSRECESLSERDVALASSLCVPVALALQNAQYYAAAAHQAQVMEEALRRLQELDRMKDEMIQNISHELRTPVALVLGYTEMLHDGQLGPLTPEQQSAINVVTRRTRMLRSMVEDISLLWSLEAHEQTREPVDMVELVQSTAREFEHLAKEKNLTLAISTPNTEVCIAGVPFQLRRVLDNLIGNALKFTPPGGQIEVALVELDNEVRFWVADDGVGIPLDKLGRIFDRFYQVDGSSRRRYGGMGIGLALVRTIVEAHGGTVTAESPITCDPHRPGTRIVVRLPRPVPMRKTDEVP